jgi:hypothetical protein
MDQGKIKKDKNVSSDYFSYGLEWLRENSTDSDSAQAKQELKFIAADEALRSAELVNDGLETDNQGKKLDNELRKKFSNHIFWLLFFWLFSVIAIICLHGLNIMFCTTSVIITTLLGSSTAGIIGLFWLVARYIFPNRDK